MMLAALAALAFGAVAGIFLATRHFLRKRLPASVALLHGLGGATGFTLVLLVVVQEPDFKPIRDVLYFLIATVLLGAVNLLFHIRKVRHRTSLILLHGLTAVTSAGLLIRAIFVHVPTQEAAPPPTPVPPPAASVASAPVAPQGQIAVDAAPTLADAAASAADAAAGEARPGELVVPESVSRALSRAINFETKSAQMSEDSVASIAEIASELKAHPEITLLEIQGHADERGDEARNLELTRARAAAVVNALAERGIARRRLGSAGYGARCPEALECRESAAPDSCHSPESWQRDRRVAFVVLQVGSAAYAGEVACTRGADLIPAAHRRFHKAAD